MRLFDLQYQLLLTARNLKTFVLRGRMRKEQLRLARTKRMQKKLFSSYAVDFSRHYKAVERFPFQKFVTPLWKDFNNKIQAILIPRPPFAFLNHPVVMFTMFGGSAFGYELSYLRKRYAKAELRRVLAEDYAGDPLLVSSEYMTSFNAIRQLYLLTYYFENAKLDVQKIASVVEWGGGYGSMAKLLLRIRKKPLTYIMIDTPLFAVLQWLYLSVVVGKERVVLIKKPNQKIPKNKIVIFPLGLVPMYAAKIHGELFISTWGLSESAKYAQDFVASRKWFGAKHLMLGYQQKSDDLPSAEYIGKLARKKKVSVDSLPMLPNNFFAYV